MPLLKLTDIDVAFAGPKLLDSIQLQVEPGDRIGLLGRNGMGKSTLLKVINRQLTPDSGRIELGQGIRVKTLIQQVPEDTQGTIFDVVAAGLEKLGTTLSRYHHVIQQLNNDSSPALLQQLERLQHEIEEQNGWQFNQQIEKVLSRLDLPADIEFATLSGGLKRRVLLAQALVCDPHILLLDEPTNHLDIASITWLEKFLSDYQGALIFITHDRSFLQAVANRIIELDRGQLTDYPGNYQSYLVQKAHALEVEQTHNALFDKKLAQEEAWIRQGIKARRTRNEGRVRALEQLRRERSQRREVVGRANMAVQVGEKSAKSVIIAEKVNYQIGDKTIIKNFSTIIDRGDKVGIIGPNGCGKTTLINLLLGNLQPTSGSARLGERLEIAFFDQLRTQLDLEKTVEENISQGSEFIVQNGNRKHIIGYCQDFLFTPQQARGSMKALSGGERNRVLLASLFAKPANFLVLDEPTNDLDLETLELLEDLLVQFTGTVLIVSHDRAFLNNVVTNTLVYQGDGEFQEYVGGYEDYLEQSARQVKPVSKQPIKTAPAQTTPKPTNKLSYKEQRELDALPAMIEKLEAELSELQMQLADPDFYRQNDAKSKEIGARLQHVQDEITKCYARWEELEQ